MWTYYLWAHPPGSVSGHIFRHHSDVVETWVRDLGDSAQGYWTSAGMWTEDRGCCPTKTKRTETISWWPGRDYTGTFVLFQQTIAEYYNKYSHVWFLHKIPGGPATNMNTNALKNNGQHKTSRRTIVSGDGYHAKHEQCPVQRKRPCLETQRHGAAQSIVGKEIPSASLWDQSWSLDDNLDQHSTSVGTESRSRIISLQKLCSPVLYTFSTLTLHSPDYNSQSAPQLTREK